MPVADRGDVYGIFPLGRPRDRLVNSVAILGRRQVRQSCSAGSEMWGNCRHITSGDAGPSAHAAWYSVTPIPEGKELGSSVICLSGDGDGSLGPD